MKVITLANAKGGVGKTTSSVNIATILASLGFKVLLKDADSQGSATEWVEDIENLPFDFEVANQRNIGKAIGYDYVVIDTPPQSADIINSAINVADLVIIPMEASEIELTRAFALTDSMKPGTLRKVLLTRVNKQTNSFKYVKEVLKEEKVEHFKTFIPKSEKIKNCFGRLPSHPKELIDYQDLVTEILELIT